MLKVEVVEVRQGVGERPGQGEQVRVLEGSRRLGLLVCRVAGSPLEGKQVRVRGVRGARL